MKKVLLALFSIGFFLTSFTLMSSKDSIVKPTQSEESGIQFKSISFADALKQAQKEKKIIFIDAYASWCGPCKLMAKNTFTDAKVGEFFNSRFVNLKIDMEKDADGPEIMKKYKVSAYPTFLFIDGNGKLVHSLMGYQNASQFLGSVQAVIK
jgi:thiol:disulfide interchange protein